MKVSFPKSPETRNTAGGWIERLWLLERGGDSIIPFEVMYTKRKLANLNIVECDDNDLIANRDLKLKFISIRRAEEDQVTHRFKDRVSVIQQE